MILLFISFISGLLTVLAPCILPVLPIIVGGSLVDGKIHRQKVFTIVTSLIISIVLFTFLLKVSTVFIDIPSYFWQWVSGGIIIVLGVAVYFPRLWNNRLFARINQKSHRTIGRESQKKQFFW